MRHCGRSAKFLLMKLAAPSTPAPLPRAYRMQTYHSGSRARQFVRDRYLKYLGGRRRYQVPGDGHTRQNETLERDGFF